MKITKAAIRKVGAWHRLFIVIDGIEYQVPMTKPIILIQGIAALPDELEGAAQSFAPLTDLANENSGSEFSGTNDPVFVEIVRRAVIDPEREGDIAVPTPAEASAAAGTWALDATESLVKK
jgi:hypothetical protein